MSIESFVKSVSDPYERKARLFPGLLAVLPLAVPFVALYGARHPVLSGFLGLATSCGGAYLLASLARGLGKQTEERLIADWGGLPTTIALRHSDSHLDPITKARYHDLIVKKLGIDMPAAADEAKDSVRADQAYMAAARRLRELTRGKAGLLLKENTAYGFHRNMLGLKPIGVLVSFLAIVFGIYLTGGVAPAAPYVVAEKLLTPGLPAGLTVLLGIAFFIFWTGYISAANVRRIGFAYAERLFEQLPSLRVSVKKADAQEEQAEASPS